MDSSDASRSETKTEPWYADGLRFTCWRCGRCCRGAPGYVWLEDEERERIADWRDIPLVEFTERYCRRVRFRWSLRERPNGDCIMLEDNLCSIYPVRPRQCRVFPFWKDIVSSRRRWEKAARNCPGIGVGRTYSPDQIERLIDADGAT